MSWGDAQPPKPPANFEAEQAILGAVLVNNAAHHEVAAFLRPEHFADPVHGRIWEGVSKLIERGQVASAGLLKAFFESEEALKPVGGVAYIARLAAAAVSIIDCKDYAGQIVDLAKRRSLMGLCQSYILEAAKPDAAVQADDMLEAFEADLHVVAQGGRVDDRTQPVAKAAAAAMDGIDEAMRVAVLPAAERDKRRRSTGLAAVDRRFRMEEGDLIIVAGRPSMGKSALVDGIASINEARGVPSAIFTREMPNEKWTRRRLARLSGVSEQKMASGDVGRDEYEMIHKAREWLDRMPCFLDDRASTVAAIASRARRLKRRHGIGLLVVDYLQLIEAEGRNRGANRVQDVSEITRALKLLAMELRLPLIAVSQLSRAVESRDDKRPTLSDLRESGSIEQDADSVLMVYREEYYLARSGPVGRGGKPPSADDEAAHAARLEACRGKAEVICAKQRAGEAGWTATVGWEGSRTRFVDLTSGYGGHHGEDGS